MSRWKSGIRVCFPGLPVPVSFKFLFLFIVSFGICACQMYFSCHCHLIESLPPSLSLPSRKIKTEAKHQDFDNLCWIERGSSFGVVLESLINFQENEMINEKRVWEMIIFLEWKVVWRRNWGFEREGRREKELWNWFYEKEDTKARTEIL